MTTFTTPPVVASLLLLAGMNPAYTCEAIHTHPEFQFSNFIFNQSDVELSLLTSDTESVDAEDFLNQLIEQHSLSDQMPAARAWVAEEVYAGRNTIAALRLKAGLTQSQLAKMLDAPQSSISRLEAGRENPSFERAKKMADALRVTLDEFYLAFELTRTEHQV